MPIMHTVRGTKIIGAVWLLALAFLPGARLAEAAAPPSLGAVTISRASVGKYAVQELAFSVRTDAPNVFLPFDPKPPPYAANLKADEDARRGVSVDALFLPPGEADWRRARVQPAFWYRGFQFTPPLNQNHETDNLAFTGEEGWRARFAPDRVGQWRFRVRVRDAGGTAEGPEGAFACVPSALPGFVRVSPTDSRYLVWDNGQVCSFVGDNWQGRHDLWDTWDTAMAEHAQGGAHVLVRHWLGGRNGMEVYGGFANSNGGRVWNFRNDTPRPDTLTQTDAHGGRFSVRVPAGGDLSADVPVFPNRAYTVGVWVKALPSAETAACHLEARDTDSFQSVGAADGAARGSVWTHLTLPIPAHDADNGKPYFLRVKLSVLDGAGGLLCDDWTVGDDRTGQDALQVGDFERHVAPNLRQAFLVDHMVQSAARFGQFLRLVCFDNDDAVYADIGSDGRSAPHAADNFWGRGTDIHADLPVRRFQAYAARYFVARWGASASVAEWEYNNEGAPFNGNHYAAAEAFARALHGFAAHGRAMAGTSFYQNVSGTSYPGDFYENPAYPDIDYADVHYYPGASQSAGAFIPFNSDTFNFGMRGFVRDPTGGPDGWGQLRASAQSIAAYKGDSNFGQQQFPLYRIQGKGCWTLSGWFFASSDSSFERVGPRLLLTVNDLPGGPLRVTAGPSQLTGGYGWRRFSASFTIPDGARHLQCALHYQIAGLTAGTTALSDVRLTAPDGLPWLNITFAEPLLNTNAAALAEYLPLQYVPFSGYPALGKPFSVGETALPDAKGQPSADAMNADTDGLYLRRWAWAHLNPSGATIFWWNTADRAGAHGFWRYAAAYQRFAGNLPLANGRYRNIEAAASVPHWEIIGQKDTKAGRAHCYVYDPAGRPLQGTLTVPGLPPGFYTATLWDTGRGQPVKTLVLRGAGGALRVPMQWPEPEAALLVTPAKALRRFVPKGAG